MRRGPLEAGRERELTRARCSGGRAPTTKPRKVPKVSWTGNDDHAAPPPGGDTDSKQRVHGRRDDTVDLTRQRGDEAKKAILAELRLQLESHALHEIRVEQLAQNAGLTRTGFYFYFDSKFAALADLLHDHGCRLEQWAELSPSTTPDALVDSIVDRIVGALATDDPVLRACHAAQFHNRRVKTELHHLEELTKAEILRILTDNGINVPRPQCELAGLVQVLVATTVRVASGDPQFVHGIDNDGLAGIVRTLWLQTLWPPAASV